MGQVVAQANCQVAHATRQNLRDRPESVSEHTGRAMLPQFALPVISQVRRAESAG